MCAEDRNRRDCLALRAINPENGQECEVLISYDRMQAVARRSMGQAKECGYVVPAILQAPTAVFEGIRTDGDEPRKGVGWRCYCGIPDRAYHSDGSERSPYPNQVFLVFVNDEGIAYNWRWEKADEADPQLPVSHKDRFSNRKL